MSLLTRGSEGTTTFYSRIAFLQHDRISRPHDICVDSAGILCTVSDILLLFVFSLYYKCTQEP